MTNYTHPIIEYDNKTPTIKFQYGNYFGEHNFGPSRHDQRINLINVPKNASMFLDSVVMDEDTVNKNNSVVTFSAIRNPLHRFISAYFFCGKPDISFSFFVEEFINGNLRLLYPSDENLISHFMPQSIFINSGLKYFGDLSYIFSVETLKKLGTESVFGTMGISIKEKSFFKNQTTYTKDAENYMKILENDFNPWFSEFFKEDIILYSKFCSGIHFIE